MEPQVEQWVAWGNIHLIDLTSFTILHSKGIFPILSRRLSEISEKIWIGLFRSKKVGEKAFERIPLKV